MGKGRCGQYETMQSIFVNIFLKCRNSVTQLANINKN